MYFEKDSKIKAQYISYSFSGQCHKWVGNRSTIFPKKGKKKRHGRTNQVGHFGYQDSVLFSKSRMKKLIQLLVLAALAAMAMTAQAQFTYTTNGGNIIISGYTGSGGAVIIPSTANGMSVVGIGTNAFAQTPSQVFTSLVLLSALAIMRSLIATA